MVNNNAKNRESWGSRLGIILAVAGSAVGLGNFLRFPGLAARNGGGAFMIPYIIALLILGIPLMWIEWTIGRFGGGFGHGTAPGIFHNMWTKNRFIKYFGVIGIFGPIVILMYYTYIESWLLGYAFYSITPQYSALSTTEQVAGFFSYYLNSNARYIFFVITFVINIVIIYFGIKKGIEKFCNWAMPVLFILAIFLLIRVLTLGPLNVSNPDWTPIKGLNYLWKPDFTKLKDAKVWLDAAGQIFFTLSVGIGVILTYASYLKKQDDVILSGLTSSATNEFAEVILGGSIIIPAAFAFLGPENIVNVVNSSVFSLGFITMPMIFNNITFGNVFAFMWFILLFLAGVTSSVSLAQPAVTFLEDEFDIPKNNAVISFATITFLFCLPSVFLMNYGVVDELDFWGGTFSLVLFGCIESILFSWIFGIDRAWDEMHTGADIRLPKIYKFIIKYVTPVVLIIILGSYLFQGGINFNKGFLWFDVRQTNIYKVITLVEVPKENISAILFTRIYLLTIFVILAVMVREAWKKRRKN